MIEQPIFKLKQNNYINLIVFLAPLLNFLPGLSFDMYAPSMPAIAMQFHVSPMLVKNTMSAMLLGMMVGALPFGLLIDSIGRKRSLLYGLIIYIIASLFAAISPSITQVIIARFLQGMSVISLSIGCRAIIADNIIGPRYTIAVLYTSIAYGLAPILGPYFGSFIQYYLGWRANFYIYAIFAIILLSLLLLFLTESIPHRHSLSFSSIMSQAINVLKHKLFIACALLAVLMQIELLFYPTFGPFIVQNVLHQNVLIFGRTALIVGAGYLTGTLINRILLKFFSAKIICHIGYLLITLWVLTAVVFALFLQLNLTTLILPILGICLSLGFIYSHILAAISKFFPHNAGVAMSLFMGLLTLGAAISIFILSHFNISSLTTLAMIYVITLIPQLIIFFIIRSRFFV